MEMSDITEAFLRSIDIHTVLPQQEPFVMVQTLTRFALDTSTTQTCIHEDNLLVDEGCFSAAGLMENMAQTCAARVGFYNRYILNKPVRVGVIGAIRDYQIFRLPPVGSLLTTTVDVEEEIFGMTLARGVVRCDGEILATACIKLSESDGGMRE